MKIHALIVFLTISAVCVRGEDVKPDAPKVDAPKPPAHPLGYQNTPMQPNGKWHVHDGLRPQPVVVTPGSFSTQEKPGAAPSDAVVLFDGTNLDKWTAGGGKPAAWKIADGVATVARGQITTKEEFGDFQLHVEWSAPNPPKGNSQERGNSGIFLHGKYEIQVLDCYNNPSYPDGMTGSVYGQYPPLVNACMKPGEWQVYDIIFTGPRFKEGKVETPAYVTVILNGIVTQVHTEIQGPTQHQNTTHYTPYSGKGPISLQDHGNPVRYRNIWIRELKADDAQ